MQNKIRIVRDGVPHYVAPWFNTLSADTRKICGRQGPMACDPKGQLDLGLPSMTEQLSLVLPCKSAAAPSKSKPVLSDLERELAAALMLLMQLHDVRAKPRPSDWAKVRKALRKVPV